MPPPRLQRLLDRQAEALARLSDAEVRSLLRAYDDGRRELRERLQQQTTAPGTPFTLQQVAVTLAQFEAGVAQLQRRMGVVLDAGVQRQQERALADLIALVGRADPGFSKVAPPIRVAVLQRLAEQRSLLLHRHSLKRYGAQLVEDIQRELTTAVARGLTYRQMADRLAGPGGVLDGQRGRAALITRMEMARAHGDAAQASLEETAALLDEPNTNDPMLAKASEYRDRTNHPFSRVLHGRVRAADGAWEVPHRLVVAEARRLNKRITGILWERRGGLWVGNRYPAHFNDRGRQVPWRASWETRDLPAPPRPQPKPQPKPKPTPRKAAGRTPPQPATQPPATPPKKKAPGRSGVPPIVPAPASPPTPTRSPVTQRVPSARADVAGQMREDGQLVESKLFGLLSKDEVFRQAVGELRSGVDAGLELVPTDIREALLERGCRVVLRARYTDGIIPHPGDDLPKLNAGVYGLFRVRTGDVSVFLEPTMYHRFMGSSHTLLHETAHACDFYKHRGERHGAQSHSARRWFRGWHINASRDGSLKRALLAAGTPRAAVGRYLAAMSDDRYNPVTTAEAWAEVLAHVWRTPSGRRTFEGAFPGIVETMEQEIRDELRLWD